MFSAKQGHYWYYFYNVFGMMRLWYDAVLDWGLNPGPPALEASTLPLGSRGGSIQYDLIQSKIYDNKIFQYC